MKDQPFDHNPYFHLSTYEEEKYFQECPYDRHGDCISCKYLKSEQYAEGWMHKRYSCKVGKR